MMVEEYVPGPRTDRRGDGRRRRWRSPRSCRRRLEFYDYEAKYAPGGSDHVIPAKLSRAVTEEAMRLAERAHEALGCRGVSRTDFRYDDTRAQNRLIVLETNTQPGMTPTSLVPEQAAYQGMSFNALVPLDRGGRLMRPVKRTRARRPRRVRDSTRGKAKSRTPSARGGRRASASSRKAMATSCARASAGSARCSVPPPDADSDAAARLRWRRLVDSVAGGHLSRLCRRASSPVMAHARVSRVADISLAGTDRTSAADAVRRARHRARASPSSPSMLPDARARLLDLQWVGDAEVRRTLARAQSPSG